MRVSLNGRPSRMDLGRGDHVAESREEELAAALRHGVGTGILPPGWAGLSTRTGMSPGQGEGPARSPAWSQDNSRMREGRPRLSHLSVSLCLCVSLSLSL